MLAYLVNQYPAVSHTFIRREIQELERQGHAIERFAIRRSAAPLVDAVDRAEAANTTYCLEQSPVTLLASVLRAGLRRPRALLRALGRSVALGLRSERSVLRHLVYLVEACHLLERMQRAGIEHLHVHFGTNPASVALLIRELGGPRFSFTVHGQEEFDAPRALALDWKVAEAEFAVAISHYGAAQLGRWVAPEHRQKIHVVRCFVDESFFQESSGIDEECRTLLWIGRLSPEKDPAQTLEAVARLRCEELPAHLVMVGDGPLRAALEARARELGLEVEFTGFLDAGGVRARLRDSRCLLLPSPAEGLPVVIMEALAMGRPVVSTYVAGIPELVVPGENGWLVPASDFESLVSALREVLETPASRLTEMGKAGRERVRERHYGPREVKRLGALLARSLPGGPAS